MKNATLLPALFAAAAFTLSLAPVAGAATKTWDGGAGAPGNWADSLNWSTDVAPVLGDALTFTGTVQTSTINNFAAGTSFAGITFNNATTAGVFTLSGSSITLAGSITTTGTTGTPTHAIDLDMVLNADRAIIPVLNNNITVNGVISESGTGRALTKGNVGTLTLKGANSFTGPMWVQGGNLIAGSIADAGVSSALGAGSLIKLGAGANSATLIYNGTTAVSTNRQVQVGVTSGTFVPNGGAVLNNSSGTGDLTFTNANFNSPDAAATANRTLTLAGASNGYVQGVISDNTITALVGLTKQGPGTWTVSGANTYSGVTAVNVGKLLINGDQSAATGNVTVAASATLGGHGTIGGATTITNNGILAPGDLIDSTDTLTLNTKALTLSGSDTKVNLDIAGTAAGSFDRVVGIDSFTQGGDITLTISGVYASASWDLFDFVSKTGNFDTVSLAGSYTGTLTRVGEIWSASDIGGNSWEFDQTTGVLITIPEPSTPAFIALGLMTAIALRRRRRM